MYPLVLTQQRTKRFLLSATLILAGLVGPSTGPGGRIGGIASVSLASEAIFRADFSSKEDLNRDRWPDLWQRRTDRQHPSFVKMEIITQSQVSDAEVQAIRRSLAQWYIGLQQSRLPGDVFAEAVPDSVDRFLESTVFNPCLEIRMDGGAAQVDGPSIPVVPEQAYRLTGNVSCELLDPFEVKISVVWLTASGEEISEVSSPSIETTSGWQTISLNSLESIPRDSKFAKIRLHVLPKSKKSLFGTIRFDSIQLNRIPRLDLQMIPKNRIVEEGESILLRCTLDAHDHESSNIGLTVVDHDGTVVWNSRAHTETLIERNSAIENGQSDQQAKTSYARTSSRILEWKVPLLQSGFYRFHVATSAESSIRFAKSTTAIAYAKNSSPKLNTIANRKIGWSLPTAGIEIPLDELPQILSFASVGRIKVSIWLVMFKSSTQRPLEWLTESIATRNIDCSGVISAEPAWRRLDRTLEDEASANDRLIKHDDSKTNNRIRSADPTDKNATDVEASEHLAEIFENPKSLDTIFQPLWTKASLLLNNYQVGWDDDLSLSQNGKWRDVLTKLSLQVRRFAPESQLIAPWDMLDDPAAMENAKPRLVNRLMLVSTSSLTGDELTRFNQNAGPNLVGSWVSMDPIDSYTYSMEDRLRDLVQRSIAIHASRLETGWISNPCSASIRILDAKGGPEDLLLPIRTLSQTLDNAEDFFSFPVDQPFVENAVFRSGSSEHMILWAYQPQWIDAQWGDHWLAFDIWGRPVPIRNDEKSSINSKQVQIGRWPVIVKNVDSEVIKWQVDVRVENPIIENRIGQSDPILVSIKNPSNKTMNGNLAILAANIFQGGLASKEFSIEPHSQKTISVPVTLRRDVSKSSEPVEIVIDLATQPVTKFSVRRTLSLGLKNFQLETQTRLDDRGRLVIEMEMTNTSGQPSTFDCTLHIPDRPRERIQIINLGERVTRSIVIPYSPAYRGQTLLIRCEEIGTGRILNQRVTMPE